MGLYDRVLDCARFDPSRYRRFVIDGAPVGWVAEAFLPRLSARAKCFVVTDTEVGLSPSLNGYAARSEAVNADLRAIYDDNSDGFGRWCGEASPVAPDYGADPLLEIERGAIAVLGVFNHGVHLNGYTRRNGMTQMWIARRSRSIASQPGQLDQIAAGFLPLGQPALPKLIEEAGEECGIPAPLARRARPVGGITYCRGLPLGVLRGGVIIHDLELPVDFDPVNRDGEIEAFHLWPLAEVRRVLEDGAAFKFDCALVAIDFLIRHGAVTPDEPDYLRLVRDMRQ